MRQRGPSSPEEEMTALSLVQALERFLRQDLGGGSEPDELDGLFPDAQGPDPNEPDPF